MKTKIRKSLSWIFLVFVLFTILAFSFRHRIKNSIFYYYGKINSRIKQDRVATCKDCEVLFTDGIPAHETAYLKEKISEQETADGLYGLEQKNILNRIESNDFYIVRDFSHSQPLLMPKAITFLNMLSDSYHRACENKNLTYIPFEITSATRTRNSVKKLMGENPNSIKNSAHLRGKTFDVSYTAFTGNQSQLKLFTEALSELRLQKKCFVKYEKNGCLHITVN